MTQTLYPKKKKNRFYEGKSQRRVFAASYDAPKAKPTTTNTDRPTQLHT